MARILILGGGYGGLQVALRLVGLLPRNGQHEITLVDQNDGHQIIVRLHEVAGGALDCDDVLIPFARLLGSKPIRFVRALVEGINFEGRQVQTTEGVFDYDKLVIAVGSETNFFNVPGLKENSFELKSLRDAAEIKSRVAQLFARAAGEPDPARRREMLTVVVGGGGFTGTELAGELADYRDDLARHHNLNPNEAKVAVCEARDLLLAGFDRILADKALRILQHKEVDIRLGSGLASIEDGTVMLSTGQSLRTTTLIWTGGVKASHLIASLGLQTGAGGRAIINPYSESVDYPSVYLVGDCSLVLDPETGRPMAPSAQLALQQGSLVAYNISAEIRDKPRLRLKPKLVAEIVSVGRYDAVGMIGPLRLSGLIPSLLKWAVDYRYLYTIGGLSLVFEKLWPDGRTFAKLTRAFRHSSPWNRRGAK